MRTVMLLIVALACAGPGLAKPAPKPKPKPTPAPAKPAAVQQAVARVVQIRPVEKKGNTKLEYARPDKWFNAYDSMDDYVHDRLRTDANTVAALEFVIGGRVGLNKSSVVEIASESSVKEQDKPMVKRIVLHQGGMWAKLPKRSDTLEIQTSGGVMGIKGTEFVIDTPPEGSSGNTTLSVLEGSVEVKDTTGKTVGTCSPGQQYVLALAQAPVVKTYKPEELRDQLKDSKEWKDFMTVFDWIDKYVPVVGGLVSDVGGGTVTDVATGLKAATMEPDPVAGARRFIQELPVVGGILGTPKPTFPTKLSPDAGHPDPDHPDPKAGVVNGSPTFSWYAVDDADGYVILISQHEGFDQVEWTCRVKADNDDLKVAYPPDCRPLLPGKHFWRVVPVDEDNKLVRGRKGSQAFFMVQ